MQTATDLPRIPLSALHLSPLNARKTRTGAVDDLAASIAAHGLRIEIGEQIVEISGLTREQIKAIPPVMFRKIALTLDAT